MKILTLSEHLKVRKWSREICEAFFFLESRVSRSTPSPTAAAQIFSRCERLSDGGEMMTRTNVSLINRMFLHPKNLSLKSRAWPSCGLSRTASVAASTFGIGSLSMHACCNCSAAHVSISGELFLQCFKSNSLCLYAILSSGLKHR